MMLFYTKPNVFEKKNPFVDKIPKKMGLFCTYYYVVCVCVLFTARHCGSLACLPTIILVKKKLFNMLEAYLFCFFGMGAFSKSLEFIEFIMKYYEFIKYKKERAEIMYYTSSYTTKHGPGSTKNVSVSV